MAIVLIVVGVLVVIALILYLLWPTIAAVCFPTPAPLATQAVMAAVEKGGGSTVSCAAADAREHAALGRTSPFRPNMLGA